MFQIEVVILKLFSECTEASYLDCKNCFKLRLWWMLSLPCQEGYLDQKEFLQIEVQMSSFLKCQEAYLDKKIASGWGSDCQAFSSMSRSIPGSKELLLMEVLLSHFVEYQEGYNLDWRTCCMLTKLCKVPRRISVSKGFASDWGLNVKHGGMSGSNISRSKELVQSNVLMNVKNVVVLYGIFIPSVITIPVREFSH